MSWWLHCSQKFLLFYSHRGSKPFPRLFKCTSCILMYSFNVYHDMFICMKVHMWLLPTPCICVARNTLRQKDSPFPEYFYMAWWCSICPAAPDCRCWARTAPRIFSSPVLLHPSLHHFPDHTTTLRQEWRVKQGFLQQPFPCRGWARASSFLHHSHDIFF